MKKFLCSILIFVLALCLVGCGESNEVVLARKISKNTTNLLNAINSLEEVTQSDVAINEFDGNFQNVNFSTTSPYQTAKVSKIKQIFKRHNLTNIKDINETHTPQFMNEKTKTSENQNNNYSKRIVYSPRYVSNTNNQQNYVNNLDLFKNKIESLYNACQDCNYIVGQCSNTQNQLKTACQECKTLCTKLENGEIKLTDEELNLCNTYCNQINSYCDQIKDCKGNCTNYLNTLKALKGYFGSNSETLVTNYINLLGCLENRLNCYNGALECVNNCNNLLKNCQTNQNSKNYEIDSNITNINKEKKNETPFYRDIQNGNKLGHNKNQAPNPDFNNSNNPNFVNPNLPNGVNYGYNNGYNSNNFYNGYNGFNNGYYNQTPNNVNTYANGYRNIDTYKNANYPNNFNQVENYENNMNNDILNANEDNKTIIEKDNSNKTEKIDILNEDEQANNNILNEEKFVDIKDIKNKNGNQILNNKDNILTENEKNLTENENVKDETEEKETKDFTTLEFKNEEMLVKNNNEIQEKAEENNEILNNLTSSDEKTEQAIM